MGTDCRVAPIPTSSSTTETTTSSSTSTTSTTLPTITGQYTVQLHCGFADPENNPPVPVCGCVVDPAVLATGPLQLLGSPDEPPGTAEGSLGPLTNLKLPASGTGLTGTCDSFGCRLQGDDCDPSTGCCFGAYIEFGGPPDPDLHTIGVLVFIGINCTDPARSCGDAFEGSASLIPSE